MFHKGVKQLLWLSLGISKYLGIKVDTWGAGWRTSCIVWNGHI